MDTVLFVGSRSAALRAASRMGVAALVLADRRPTRRVLGSALVELGAPPERLLAQAAPLLHGRRVAAVVATTEQSVVAAAHLRRSLGLPGPDVETAHRCHDKVAMKEAIRAAGVPCADFVAVDGRTKPADLVERLGLPMILKPRGSSGSRDALVVHEARQLGHAVGPDMIAERLVHGTEMSVETFVVDGRPVFRNHTEYHVPFWVNVLPAPLRGVERREIDALVDRATAALGIRDGVTHLELFRTSDGPVFGELALRPPGGHLMELLGEAYGFDAWEAVLAMALGRAVDLPQHPERVAAAWILHPGPGRVASVTGVERARRVPHVSHVTCRVTAGDEVSPRVGSGDEVGHLRAAAATRGQALGALHQARALVAIRLSDGARPTTPAPPPFHDATAPFASSRAPGRAPRDGAERLEELAAVRHSLRSAFSRSSSATSPAPSSARSSSRLSCPSASPRAS